MKAMLAIIVVRKINWQSLVDVQSGALHEICRCCGSGAVAVKVGRVGNHFRSTGDRLRL